jgi:hypothetical protein
VLFGAAYATGAAVGPVAPGLHPTGGSGPGSPGSDGSGSGGMDLGKGH